MNVNRLIFLVAVVLTLPGILRADVIVLVNRTKAAIQFATDLDPKKSESYTLNAGEVLTIPMRRSAQLRCEAAEPPLYQLEANSAYYFQDSGGTVSLHQIDLQGSAATSAGRDFGELPLDAVKVVPVKLLVDDEEQGRREIWETRLRKRVVNASEIFERLFRIRFEVVAAETWQSDSLEAGAAAAEFESEVKSQPARLAIGFTSQLAIFDKGVFSETLPPPLHTHLLICDRSPRHTETEKLEILIHQLGHWLGAVHSPEATSVMRTQLSDGSARRNDFKLTFDPVNALAIYLVGEEFRLRDISEMAQLTEGTKARLDAIYRVMENVASNDAVTSRWFQLLGSTSPASDPSLPIPPPTSSTSRSREEAVQLILKNVVVAARSNALRSETSTGNVVGRLEGDALTELYVKVAARAAMEQPREVASQAFLIAIGIALDDSNVLRDNPLSRNICTKAESNERRNERLKVIGRPTLRNRRDLAQHFAVSTFLAAAFTHDVAESAGVAKEVLDSRRGSGFSFADLAADFAGVAFARSLLAERLSLQEIAQNFTVNDFMPTIDQLPEGLDSEEFAERFGSVTDPRFQELVAQIRSRIAKLPAYDIRGV